MKNPTRLDQPIVYDVSNPILVEGLTLADETVKTLLQRVDEQLVDNFVKKNKASWTSKRAIGQLDGLLHATVFRSQAD